MRGESARPGKRPLRALSASEKMEAIQRVHEGESKASVARDIGVPESTLRGWCKSEHKIRGMARNSSTPDSDPHSPSSSSGGNPLGLAGASNLSSEDEALGPSTSKKPKLDSMSGACEMPEAASVEAKLDNKQPKLDYMSSIINSLVASGVRSENSSILLQQLGLLSSAQSAANLTKNLLGLGSSHLAGSPQTVGLVENGLQYTKSSGGSGSSKRPSMHASAIAHAPTTSGSRKSLPPAAEAPSTPVPASPRKTGEQQHNGGCGMQQQMHARSSRRDNGSLGASSSSSSSSARKADDALWLWLAQQQQQLLGQQAAAPFNPSASGVDGSWFWQWYKQCSFPVVASAALGAPASQPHQQQPQQHATQLSRKSPSKAKAMLDNVLCNNNNNNNNNDSVGTTLNLSSNNGVSTTDEDESEAQSEPPINPDEAIEHGEQFFKWLDKCSEPSVTRLQIMQFKYLLDNLKSCRKKTSSSKHSRK